MNDIFLTKQFRSWDICLYPENTFYCDLYNTEPLDVHAVLYYLTHEKNLAEYAYILHDCDYYSDGTREKDHFHVWLYFNSGIRCKTLMRRYNIPFQCFNFNKSARGTLCEHDREFRLKYLCHANKIDKEQGKFPYSVSAVKTNIVDFARIVSVEAFDVTIRDLCYFGREHSKNDTFEWSIEHNCLGLFRQWASVIDSLRAERNDQLYRESVLQAQNDWFSRNKDSIDLIDSGFRYCCSDDSYAISNFK